MAVVGTPTIFTNPISVDPSTGAGIGGLGPGGCVTYEAIRCFLLDSPESNFLDGLQIKYSDKQIDQAIMMAVGEYNVIAPLNVRLKFDGSDWPTEAPHLLILGAASYLLKQTANEQLRNQFNAQDGNIPRVGVYDKFPQFLQYAQTLQQEFRDGVSHYKKLRDFESTMGRSYSPLTRRGGYWY